MTGNATRNKTIIRIGVAALVAAALQFGAAVQSAEAADQIRLKLKNSAAFTVSKITMWASDACIQGSCVSPKILDHRHKNTSVGQSRNVKYNMGDLGLISIGAVWFEYNILASANKKGSCFNKAVHVEEEGD